MRPQWLSSKWANLWLFCSVILLLPIVIQYHNGAFNRICPLKSFERPDPNVFNIPPNVVYAQRSQPSYDPYDTNPYLRNEDPYSRLSPELTRQDQQMHMVYDYMYQIQLLKYMQDQQQLQQLPEMIRTNQAPPNLDLNQLFALKERMGQMNTFKPPEKQWFYRSMVWWKAWVFLVNSVLNDLTGVTSATGVALGQEPKFIYNMVRPELFRIASIRGPKEEMIRANPLQSFFSSLKTSDRHSNGTVE